MSPRNSSRGGSGGNGDSHGKLSNSSVHSSPKVQELASEASGDVDKDTGENSGKAVNGNGCDISPASAVAVSPSQAQSMPPPSQPLLEGGSGIEMTSIREE